MVRLHLIVEGQTEKTFVRDVLVGHLAQFDVFADARMVVTSKKKSKKGGMTSYGRAKGDIERWMKEDEHSSCFFTTMFDLYALPDDFPDSTSITSAANPHRRVTMIENAFGQDIDSPHFIPYVQLHEFEALVLADPAKLKTEFIEQEHAIRNLVGLSESVESPELIDDGEETAPSKRIIKEIPAYEGRKASAGPRVAAAIGLPTIRAKCPHFNDWLTRLETLKPL